MKAVPLPRHKRSRALRVVPERPASVGAADSALRRVIPGAQPALCALLLAAGGIATRTAPSAAVPLYALAYLAGGVGSAVAAWHSLRRYRIDVNLLMLVAATGAAWLGEWWEGGILLVLFSLSNALEFYAMGRTRRAIRALMELRPAEALVRRNGQETVIPAESLRIGDVVVVRPAERLPADGTVIAGISGVDQSPITGESIPIDVGPGSQVFAGTINQRGSLDVRVSRNPEDTTLARIIAMVEQAQSTQAPTQRVVDRFGQVYAVLVIAGALATYGVMLHLGATSDTAFYRAISLLVVASPCALMVATPAAVLSAIAAAARHGVLFKGGVYLEKLAEADTVIFDKTGTLTLGHPAVTEVVEEASDSNTVLSTAGAVERRSEHALADAVVAACRERGLPVPAVEAFEAIPGRGVRGIVGGEVVRVGSEQFIRAEGLQISTKAQAQLARLRQEGKTPILVGARRLLGILAIADVVRPQARAAVRALRTMGIKRLGILTGDHTEVAKAIGEAVDVHDVWADLMPLEKAALVARLTRDETTVMVGDGVNDAPALAEASIGVAMGAVGTDAAMETADVVLMGDDLSRLPQAIALARRTRRVILQSLAFGALVIATLITVSLLFGLRLAFGVVGHEGSTVIVVLNGLRLLRYR